jgi:hypothetical protein
MLGPGGERNETVRHASGEAERGLLSPQGEAIHDYDRLRRKITRKSPVSAEARRLAMLDPGDGLPADVPAARQRRRAIGWRRAERPSRATPQSSSFSMRRTAA